MARIRCKSIKGETKRPAPRSGEGDYRRKQAEHLGVNACIEALSLQGKELEFYLRKIKNKMGK